ncbi:MAG: long-chain fatty acid--CoA ligase, partial [Myxococcales bacterium]
TLAPAGAAFAGREAGDGALLLATSGTTGKPKGALLTHANLATQARLIGAAWGLSEPDRLLHALPLHHMHGVVIALLSTLLAGGCVELRPRFDAVEVWDGLARSTVWMGVPTMVHKLLEAHDRADAATRARWAASARALRLAVSGSAALPVTLAARWSSIAGQIPLERFGMTEVGVALSNPLDGPRQAGFVGPALPGVDVRVVDESGRAVAPGEPGEIQVRGATVFAGYLDNPGATERAFRDGWFLTGDTATVDAGGAVKILGRTSVDILKSGGYKLSALEIEETLREHPAVAEAAVVGLPDETWGQRVEGAVVLREPMTQPVTVDDLTRFCRERLAPYKVPRRLVVMSDLPRNLLGKVLKAELAERLQSS